MITVTVTLITLYFLLKIRLKNCMCSLERKMLSTSCYKAMAYYYYYYYLLGKRQQK